MKPYIYIKNIFDYLLAITAITLLAPLFLVIGIAIKLDSNGPVFYLQERLGKNGAIFRIYKFRTMVDGAINIGTGLSTYDGDPRITRLGNLLRKTSLDEIPQLINILLGEMSLIGPRPPVPYFPRKYEEYSEYQRDRFCLLPGITGYAQIKVRNRATWDERISFDIYYVNNISFCLDCYIFFRSICVVLNQNNIYKKCSIDRNRNDKNASKY